MNQATKPVIAFVLPTLQGFGGSVRVACLLAQALQEAGYRIILISRRHFDEVSFDLDPEITSVSLELGEMRLRGLIAAARRPLVSVLKEHSVDLIFGIGSYETLISIMPSIQTRIPLVFCDHGALFNQWVEGGKSYRISRWLNQLFSRKTVVLTERSYRDYQRLCHTPARKLEVIPNWISNKIIDLYRDRSYNTASKKLVWCGRLDHEKGIDHLIEIAKLVLPVCPEWTWEVWGGSADPTQVEAFVTAIKNAGLEEQLIYRGETKSMYERYGEYAVLTLTSYREGLPMTLLEGAAAHLPLISFDVISGPAEIIEHGITGILVERYDVDAYAYELTELMHDQDRRRSFAQAQSLVVERFSQPEIFKQWINLIKSLVKH